MSFFKTIKEVYPLVWIYVCGTYGLPLITGSPSTLAAVVSGSMEPEIRRGDMIITISPKDLRIGDIIMFNVPTQPVPVVHRVSEVYADGSVLTKDDSQFLYPPEWKGKLPKQAITSKVRGHIPWIGYLSIWVQTYKPIVYSLVAIETIREIWKEKDLPTQNLWTTKQWIQFLLFPFLSD